MSTLLADSSATEVPEFLAAFAGMHAAMRRDVERLVVVAAMPSPRLARWFHHFRETLEKHHEREDTVVWPALVARDPGFGEFLGELADDHQALDHALADLGAAIAGGADCRTPAIRLRQVLRDHLDREEAAAFGRIASAFRDEEWKAVEHALLEGTSLSHLAFEVPWILDGMPAASAARLRAQLPRPVRVLHRLVFAPRYSRVAAVIRDGGR